MTVKAAKVDFHDARMWVTLDDDRVLGVPLRWFPRLNDATRAELENYEIMPMGIHWPALDEDLSIEGLLAGRRPPPRPEAEEDTVIMVR